jgi:4-amino-4-deoxy-L-arabinose transferase-like glycosyltransferase
MEAIFKKLSSRPQTSIICLGLLLLLIGNWILPLTDRDEARFSEASREMIQRHDYIVPWFNGQWRLYKPSGIYWCQIACYRVLGVNEFSARLPSVLFAIGTALVLLRWGRRVMDAKTGFLAGAMFLAALHITIVGRIATADMAVIFFFTLSAWSGWELTRPQQMSRWQWWWIFYIALALGFLAKGPEAWLPLVAMALGRALRKDSFRLPLPETIPGLALTLAIVGAWGIPALKETHGMFWSIGMNEQVYQRAVSVNNSHGFAGIIGFILPLPFYFLTFFISFFPWSPRVPGTLRRWWPERRRDDLGWYLLVLAAIVFIVFTLVKTKLPHYTLPAYPLIALWLALQISRDAQLPAWFIKRLAFTTLFVFILALGVFSYARGHLLTSNVWEATRAYVKPETKIGCYGYVEPSLVWKFRSVATNIVVLGDEHLAADFLTNPPPYILVLPTIDLTNLPNSSGQRFAVHGFDLVKFKNWDLTAIVQP